MSWKDFEITEAPPDFKASVEAWVSWINRAPTPRERGERKELAFLKLYSSTSAELEAQLKTQAHLVGSKIVTGEAMAKAICTRLVERSCMFTMTPLPDDLWQFEVRSDSVTVLDGVEPPRGLCDREILERMLQRASVRYGHSPYTDDPNLVVVENEKNDFIDVDETGGSFSGFQAVFKFDETGMLVCVYARE